MIGKTKGKERHMAEEYKIVYEGGESEIIEKKSRFIATVVPVKTEEEAIHFIEQIKKKYWDAAHNCTAYIIGEQNEIQRCSDDGEPAKTAGRPMLDVLLGEQLHDTAVVVTRYFGGTLLGTGGLVRAYQGAVKAGLSNSKIVEKKLANKYIINTDYNGIGKIQYIMSQRKLTVQNIEYTDFVKIQVLVPKEEAKPFENEVTEATAGKAHIELLEETYYGKIEKEIIIFEN